MTRNHFAIPIFVTLFFLQALPLQANRQTLQKAWDEFNNNKRKEARNLFQQAVSDADSKAEASLGLAFVNWSEDKNTAGAEAFLEFYKSAPDPYPYLYALWSSPVLFTDYGKKKPEQVKFLQQLSSEAKTNGTIHAMAHAMLGKHYESIGDFKKSEAEFAQIGAIENWQVMGTFDNTSASGFSKDYGALAKPGPDAVFKNKINAEVKWYSPPHFRSDRWFDFNYYFLIDNSVMYAQTFLESEADQDVYLQSGNSGSLKIWVNDQLVTNVPDERNCDIDVYINNIKLNKGFNRILVQIGESETNAANFLIRVTDKNGIPIKALRSVPGYQPYSKAKLYTVNRHTLFAEDFFENRIKTEPDNLINYLMLADVYLRNDKVYEARKALKKAQELAPESSFVRMRMIEAYARDKNVTDLTKTYEKIKSTDPDCSYALKSLITEAGQKEDYDEEEQLLKRYISLFGETEFSEMLTLNLAAVRNKIDQVISMTKTLCEKYPDNYDLMKLSYVIEKKTNKDPGRLNAILKEYLKNNYSDNAMTTLADNYLDMGKKKEALDIYKKRIENFPYSIGYCTDLSDLYFNSQDYANALTWAETAIAFAPSIGGYWSRAGKIYQAMNNGAKAEECYRKAVYYTPTNYEARRQLRQIQNKKDLFENFEKVNALELYKKSPGADVYPNDNSLILLNETQRVVYPEGANEERSEILVKIFNQVGIDIWKEYSISFNRYRQRLIIDKAEVFKKDGNKVQAEKNEGYLVFTNLEAGDAVHVSYRLENYNVGKLAQHFWEQFNLNFEFPSKISRYSLLLPADKQFKHEVLNADLKPAVRDLNDLTDNGTPMKLYVWEYKDQPAIKPEPFMPSLADAGVTLDISSLPDWKFISNWYADLSGALAKVDFEIKETVAELLKDKIARTDLEKAKMIYEFIEANVSYSNVPFMHGPIIPQKASRTLNTKLGDCKDVSTLFVAMCKEAGLKANLILVDTRENGERHLNLPSVDFNHCIAQLETGGKTYYVELTDQKLSFTAIPLLDMKANILFIPREGDSAAIALARLNTQNRPANNILRETSISFENNDLTISRNNVKTGMFAAQMRSEYDDIGTDKQEEAITRAISSDFSNSPKLLKLKFQNLKLLSDSFAYNYSFLIRNELKEVAGMKIFRIPWSETIQSLDFLALETRKYNFLVWNFNAAETSIETATIEIPKGKTLAEQPKNISLSCGAADYTLNWNSSKTGQLKAIRQIKYKKDIVYPADYPEFRDFFNRVAEADARQIAFR